MKFTLLQKMTMTAMLFAIYVVATRFIGVYVTPYVRLSVGVAIMIFSSILLGPISGAIIAGVGDIIGILLVNTSGVAINPFITLTYLFMGATPGLLMMLFKKVKFNLLLTKIIFAVFLLLIWAGITTSILLIPQITIFQSKIVWNIGLASKIAVPIVSFVLLALIYFFTGYLNKRFQNNTSNDSRVISPYLIAFIVLFIEIVFTLIINTFAKVGFYHIDFSIIFFPALLLAIFYIPFNTFAVYYLYKLAVKVVRLRE